MGTFEGSVKRFSFFFSTLAQIHSMRAKLFSFSKDKGIVHLCKLRHVIFLYINRGSISF